MKITGNSPKKNIRRKKSSSMNNKLVSIMLIVVLVQASLFLLIVFMSGQLRLFSDNSFTIMEDNVHNHAVSLSNLMTDTSSNLNHSVLMLRETIEEELQAEGKTAAELASNRDLSYKVIQRIYNMAITLQRRSKTTGVFVALTDGEQEHLEYFSGFYLRDADPDINLSESDLVIEVGPGQLSADHELSFDTNWTSSFKIDSQKNQQSYLTEVLQSVQKYPELAADELGYWAKPFSLNEGESQVITYAVPILGEEHQIYGVIGLEFSLEYLNSVC